MAVEREERLENEKKAKQEATEAAEAAKTGAASAASAAQSKYNRDLISPISNMDFQFWAQYIYSHVHISSDEVFSKILKKTSIVPK